MGASPLVRALLAVLLGGTVAAQQSDRTQPPQPQPAESPQHPDPPKSSPEPGQNVRIVSDATAMQLELSQRSRRVAQCSTPCLLKLDPGHYQLQATGDYVVTGTLYASVTPTLVQVRPPRGELKIGGALSIAAGVVVALWGSSLWPAPCGDYDTSESWEGLDCTFRPIEQVVAAGVIAVGLAGIGVGGAMWYLSSPRLEVGPDVR